MNILRTTFAASACILATLACPAAQASLINNNNGTFSDTGTGYVWRALAQYQGLDYTTAVTLLPAGFHPATEAELATLIAAAPADPAQFSDDSFAMGAGGFEIIWGFYGDGTQYAWKDVFDASWNSNASNSYGGTNWNYSVSPTTAFDGLSLFAVDTTTATAVPEPSALSLFGLGALLLACHGYAVRQKRWR